MPAMRGQMSQNVRMAKQRDRMRSKLAARREEKDRQIKLLETQLESARKANRILKDIQDQQSTKKPSKKKKKRRKRRNKK